MNRQYVMIGITATCLVISFLSFRPTSTRPQSDEALLSLVKNDLDGFIKFLRAGGDVHSSLPEIDGLKMSVAEGIVHYGRTSFIKHLQKEKISFLKQGHGDQDVLTIALQRNDPELFKAILEEGPKLDLKYGKGGWGLLHLASSACSHKLVYLLQSKEMNWDSKAKDGSTPLTLAAEKDCVPLLGHWKKNKAKFNVKDGRGLSALSILQRKQDTGPLAMSTVERAPAAPPEFNFYRKRTFPKEKAVDYSTMLEPEMRPSDSHETAENSEFSD